jgi:hypothetical protein
MRLNVQQYRSDHALELYVAATPEPGWRLGDEAEDVFSAVEDVVRSHGARICRERVFAVPSEREALERARAAAYSRLDALTSPDWLDAGAADGRTGGVQVHAVRGPEVWVPLRNGGQNVLGWGFEQDGRRWAVTSGLSVPQAGDGPAQTRAVFDRAAQLLAEVDMDLASVARTWIYMDDILTWYAPFNRERNRLFVERGLLARNDPTGGAEALRAFLKVTPPGPDAEMAKKQLLRAEGLASK